jgi:hypothetical protein
MQRALFVVAAHVPDGRNCDLLAQTLASIACFHPGQIVLVVDNASPLGAVDASIAAAQSRSKASGAHVVRQNVSRGQIGAWAAADRVLSEGWLRDDQPELIVLLQHSTALARPVVLPVRCEAAALSTMVNVSAGGGWLAATEYGMQWASAVAEAVRISCAPPCTRGVLPSRFAAPVPSPHSSRAPLEWAAASHAVLALSRAAFERLATLRMWPRAELQPVRAMAEMWKRAPCQNGGVRVILPCADARTIRVGLINGGLEVRDDAEKAPTRNLARPYPSNCES